MKTLKAMAARTKEVGREKERELEKREKSLLCWQQATSFLTGGGVKPLISTDGFYLWLADVVDSHLTPRFSKKESLKAGLFEDMSSNVLL